MAAKEHQFDISAKLDRVMDALDDLDDVVNVHTNAELPE